MEHVHIPRRITKDI